MLCYLATTPLLQVGNLFPGSGTCLLAFGTAGGWCASAWHDQGRQDVLFMTGQATCPIRECSIRARPAFFLLRSEQVNSPLQPLAPPMGSSPLKPLAPSA